MFRLTSSWVWDFWFAHDGDRYHLYFLKAPRALRDPDRRHFRASIGHATSSDLRAWTEHEDAIIPDDEPAFDDLATWTGSVVRDDDAGLWRMFYTGVSRDSRGLVQRISWATSPDLHVWSRAATPSVIEPDARWYESLEAGVWHDEAWRDPWVFRDADTGEWRMLVTARANEGAVDQRGVVGHARSTDLETWTVMTPLSTPDAGFGQLEVLQLERVDGRYVLLFSCATAELSKERRDAGERGGIWAVNIDDPGGPYPMSEAYRIADESLYVGRLIQGCAGQWQMLAFHNVPDGRPFIGEISDPMPVAWKDGRLTVERPAGDG